MQSNDTAPTCPDSVDPSDFSRWLEKVALPDDPDECFRWTAGLSNRGYGKFWLNGRTLGAHVVTYEWFNGPNPDGLFVCHSCTGGGNPWCVNPRHLYLDTPKGNIEFAVANGRMASGIRNGHYTKPERTPRGDAHPHRIHPGGQPRGERHGLARLTEQAVREIRFLAATTSMTHRQIAARYGVGKTVVTRAIARTAWKHVE